MRPLERSLEKLDEVRQKKLTEMIGSTANAPVPSATSSGNGSTYFILFLVFVYCITYPIEL